SLLYSLAVILWFALGYVRLLSCSLSGYNPFDVYGDLNELHLIANVNPRLISRQRFSWFPLSVLNIKKARSRHTETMFTILDATVLCFLSTIQIELVKYSF